MPTPASFDYAILRVVPRVERQEFINAGVIVFCLEKRYLAARIHLDAERLKALWPEADVALVKEHLEAIPRICDGRSRRRTHRAALAAGAISLDHLAAQHHHSAVAGAHGRVRWHGRDSRSAGEAVFGCVRAEGNSESDLASTGVF